MRLAPASSAGWERRKGPQLATALLSPRALDAANAGRLPTQMKAESTYSASD
jgi:hypothetical protein